MNQYTDPVPGAGRRMDKSGTRKRALVTVCAFMAAFIVLMVVYLANPAQGATTVPQGFGKARVTGGLSDPTAMAFAPDGRLFVSEQAGKLRVIKNGRLLRKPFLRVRSDARGARGLIGVAFDPGFASNGYVYVYYTVPATSSRPAHNRVSRFKADPQRPNVAVDGGEVILELNNLTSYVNHNGGALHFGEDGKLYVSVGDNNLSSNAQSLRNLKGKMLRINADGTIPSDNPFYDRASGKNRAIWALGLRNPFTFAVQPGSGTMYINDVGEKRWEEINRGVSGANYGWPRFEGYENRRNQYTGSVYAYRHGETATTGCAITGGTFYNPARNTFGARFGGDYFFADYCGGWIRRYDPATDRSIRFATGISSPVDLRVGDNGHLYYLARGTGSVNKIYKRR